MMRAFLFVSLFVLLLALPAFVASAAGTGALVGQIVHDSAGVAGVYVQAWDGGVSDGYRVTGAGGAFAFDALPCGRSYTLKVWKTGTPVMWYSIGVLGCGVTYDAGAIAYPPIPPVVAHVTPPAPLATPTPEPSMPPFVTPTPQPVAYITGVTWHDLNGDGIIDQAEPRYMSLQVEAVQAGAILAATHTNAGGAYRLGVPACGAYVVAVTEARGVAYVSPEVAPCAGAVVLDFDLKAGKFYLR